MLLLLAFALLVVPAASQAQTITVDGRPAFLKVPVGYDPNTPAPLVIRLHGYTSSGLGQDSYMKFSQLVDEFGFLYVTPDGTFDCVGNRFWNATIACCDLCVPASGVDDSSYVIHLIDEMKLQYNVDADRVYLIGHSNGGFMSYRAACDHAGSIAAIASLAGATFDDPNACAPSEPVHTLQIHGDLDATILYTGGATSAGPYPGAVATAETWAGYNGCSLHPSTSAPPLDLDAGLAGDETSVTRYATSCPAGGSSELWTINGGGHIPALSATFNREVIEYLYAHPKAPLAPVPTPRIVLAMLGVLVPGLFFAGRVSMRKQPR